MLELARRDCLIISDSDQPAREQQRSYRGPGKWLRYDQVLGDSKVTTSEDFLSGAAFDQILEQFRQQDARLSGLPAPDLRHSRGKLYAISRWLTRGGFQNDEIKEVLNRVKNSVFSKLTSTHIDPPYFEFLAALSQRLPRRKPRIRKRGQ